MTHKDVFILGAGFSKAIHDQMPVMKELTDEVSKLIENSELKLPPPLKDDEDRGRELDNNIELWMTYLSQRQPWLDESFNQYNLALATRIRRYIVRVIENRSNGLSKPMPNRLNSLIEFWHSRKAKVITLNYDTLVERAAIGLRSSGVFDGKSGITPNYIYPPYFSNTRSRNEFAFGFALDELDTFTYFKLHGSINWHYSGREDFYGETIFYSDVSPWGVVQSREIESRASVKDKYPLIIPPVFDKNSFFNSETVTKLWQQASEQLEGATRVFVIGYSLPMSDIGMQFFLKRSLPISKTRWYIIDISNATLRRYQCLLEPQQTVSGDFIGKNALRRFVEAYPSLP